jgi:hypothetical protein
MDTPAPTCQSTECCCNCQHQIPIHCHPGNKLIGNGSLSDQLGWGCLGFANCDDWRVAVFSESAHGLCELFSAKDTLKT